LVIGNKRSLTLVHFELPADIERAKKFYTNLFGWKIEKWEGLANNMEYWTINTTDDKGNKGLEGTIIVPKTLVPGAGYFAACLDTEGNNFGIFEENTNAK